MELRGVRFLEVRNVFVWNQLGASDLSAVQSTVQSTFEGSAIKDFTVCSLFIWDTILKSVSTLLVTVIRP